MKCEDIQFKLVMEPESAAAEDVRAHVEACAECRAFAGRDTALRNLLAAQRDAPVDPEVEERIVRGVAERIGRPRWFSLLRFDEIDPASWRWEAAAAAALVAGLLVWGVSTQMGANRPPELAVQPPAKFVPQIVHPTPVESPNLLTPPVVAVDETPASVNETNNIPEIKLEPLPGEGMIPVNYREP